jgi:GTPase SAR1 family protein
MFSQQVIITGHQKGLIVRSDLAKGAYEVLDDCHFDITAIALSPRGEALVGCHSGLVYIINLDDPTRKQTIQEPGFSNRSRIWRITVVDENNFVTASTWGVLTAYTKNPTGDWSPTSLKGHSDSIFGLASNGLLLASGDWQGKILVWEKTTSGWQRIDQLKIQTGVQGLAWYSNEVLAAVDRGGRLHIFESKEGANQWRSVFETDTASSQGSSICITDEGNTVYAGTNTELIQFDRDTQHMLQFGIHGIGAVFCDKASVYVVSGRQILSLPRKPIILPAKFARYQYSKISLIGRTGVGKTTLCSSFVNRSTAEVSSTFGKRVWIKELPEGPDGSRRRIILHDHGGQSSVLGTFLPFLTNSDIILVFFKQTDYGTFEDALEILDELEEIISNRTQVFLVQTFKDEEMRDVDPIRIKSLKDTHKIIDCLSVDSRNTSEVDELFSRIMREVSWTQAKTMIESPYAEGIFRTISQLYDSHATVVPVEQVQERFKRLMTFGVSKVHLGFLLKNLSTQGVIEYYPEIMDSIILNDAKYNKLRTDIPIFVRNHKGLVTAKSILDNFVPTEYARIIDQVYLAYRICVENDGLRIFPAKLKTEPVAVPEPHKSALQSAEPNRRTYPAQSVKVERIFEALSDLKLRCIDAAEYSGLFAWEPNAYIVYSYNTIQRPIDGDRLQFMFSVAGPKKDICDRLVWEFSEILDRFYGPQVESQETKKKSHKTYIYAVALTFASEQRKYAEKVADLIAREGLKVFYDDYMKPIAWGKNGAAFFQDVYYKDSKWCIMFVSAEYVAKKWPCIEAQHAIARQIEQFGNYILPVHFDKTEVPGLPTTLIHLSVPPETAESIASTFLKKYSMEP